MVYIFVQVETVSLKAGLDDWEINFIQGMANQLQIDARSLKPNIRGKKNEFNTAYKIMEVSGHFQTHRSLQVQFCEYPKWTF
jgi:hypothetical protein